MKKLFFPECFLEVRDASLLAKKVFADKIWQKKVKRPLIILWCLGIVLDSAFVVLLLVFHWPKCQWITLIYILGFFFVSYIIFLSTINRYAKRRLKKLGWGSKKGFFSFWEHDGLKSQRIQEFKEKSIEILSINLDRIKIDSLTAMSKIFNDEAARTNRVISIKVDSILAVISIIVSIVTAFYTKPEDKLVWTIVAVLCLLSLWSILHIAKKITEDYLNLKSRKYKEIANFFEIIELNRRINEKEKQKEDKI